MKIRKDFASASLHLERLLLYSKVFWDNSREKWGHLKTKEDFNQIYEMENEVKEKFERIYSAGRGFASTMSQMLVAFNEPAEYPTLTSYVNSFDDRWFAYIDALKGVLKDALDASDKIKHCPWAVEKMIEIFDKQLALHQDVADTINLLKSTDTYKIENGETIMKNGGTKTHNEYNFSNSSNNALNFNSPSAEAIIQSPDDIIKIVSQLSVIFQKAQFADKNHQEQSLEILDTIRDEIQKQQPKKLSVAPMISTLSNLASLATSIDKIVPFLLEKIKQFI